MLRWNIETQELMTARRAMPSAMFYRYEYKNIYTYTLRIGMYLCYVALAGTQ